MKSLFAVVALVLLSMGVVGLATEHYLYVPPWMQPMRYMGYDEQLRFHQPMYVFPATSGIGSSVNTFPRDLGYGETNSTDVSLLQEFLLTRGYYSGPVTGNFFILTLEGVRRFQRAEGLTPTGYFGIETRALANIRVSQTVGDPCRNQRCVTPPPAPAPQPGSISLSTSGSLSATTGESMSVSINVSGGSGNYAISYNQTIPGLTYMRTANALVISGMPGEAGRYDIRITATDLARNQSITQTYTFDIRSQAPVSQGTFTLVSDRVTGRAPLTVNLTATLRDMPSCGNTYQWDFGDGTSQTFVESCAGDVIYPSQRTMTVAHTYLRAGGYSVRLMIGSSAAFVPVSVSN